MTSRYGLHGDPTTTGGVVIATLATTFNGNRRMAILGDRATCGNCSGTWPIIATAERRRDRGRPTVLDRDWVACPCKKNRVIATADNMGYSHPRGEGSTARVVASGAASGVAGYPKPLHYNDHFQLIDQESGEPLAWIEYAIRRETGEIEHGTTDGSGLTHLLASTMNAENVEIYI